MMSMGSNSAPILYADDSECCGCGACVSVCPKDAITMQPDRYGFLYPSIDGDTCIHCHLCLKVCAFKCDLRVWLQAGNRNLAVGASSTYPIDTTKAPEVRK